jgi:hypothetical protein
MRLKPVIVVPVGLCVTVVSAVALYLHVESRIRGREEYHYWLPFLVGFVLALAVGLWPVARFCSQRSRAIVRSVVFTLFLAPIPYGPEGTFVPALLAMIFPPLVMLFLCPVGPLLTFFSVFGIFTSYESITSAAQGIAKPDAVPNSPPSQLPMPPENQTFDSLRTPPSGGCR